MASRPQSSTPTTAAAAVHSGAAGRRSIVRCTGEGAGRASGGLSSSCRCVRFTRAPSGGPVRRPPTAPEQVMRIGLDNIPPVTLAVLAANCALFYGPQLGLDVPPNCETFVVRCRPCMHSRLVLTAKCLLPADAVCLSARAVVDGGEWHRLLWAPFLHASDMHLYYNMASWLWKGRQLELGLGTERFARMVLILFAATHLLMVAAAMALVDVLPSAYAQCAVGFSGVLFAVKVVLQRLGPGDSAHVFGMRLPLQWASWAELAIIQVIYPQASWFGHACGILAGLAFCEGWFDALMRVARPAVRAPTRHDGWYRPRDAGGQRYGRAY